MSELAEKYAGIVNAETIATLFDKFQKHLGDNRTKAAQECGLTKKAIYDWSKLKEDVKHSTKTKILDKLIEILPAETFEYLTSQMHDASSETLMMYLSTLYENAFDARNENEFLMLVNKFEEGTKRHAGLIYKKRDEEVTDMIARLASQAKYHKIPWKPQQIHLYDSDMIKKIIPQIISSWIYVGFPTNAEELAARNKVPLEIANIVVESLNQKFLSTQQIPTPTSGSETSRYNEPTISLGWYVENNSQMMMSTAATIRPTMRSQSIPKNNELEHLAAS